MAVMKSRAADPFWILRASDAENVSILLRHHVTRQTTRRLFIKKTRLNGTEIPIINLSSHRLIFIPGLPIHLYP